MSELPDSVKLAISEFRYKYLGEFQSFEKFHEGYWTPEAQKDRYEFMEDLMKNENKSEVKD